MNVVEVLSELQKYSKTYYFSFQFWGDHANHVYIHKDDVEIYSSGDWPTPKDALTDAIMFIYHINKI